MLILKKPLVPLTNLKKNRPIRICRPIRTMFGPGFSCASNKHRNSFNNLKALLGSDALLVHFDVKKPLILVCDASPYGIGAVLAHKLKDGSEAPIAFYSRTLSSTERNYAQIDKEALAIIAGVKKFHNFLYGLNFTIYTDHKPLLRLFDPVKATADILSPRMLRWTLLLSAYNYRVIILSHDSKGMPLSIVYNQNRVNF